MRTTAKIKYVILIRIVRIKKDKRHMKISAKAEYALKAMYEIARHTQKDIYINAGEIAKLQDIPKAYLEQLIVHLKKAGLLRSIRGAKGGYVLSRKASEINANEIIEAVEGPMESGHCIGNDICIKADKCVANDVVQQLKQSIDSALNSITLQYFIDKYDNTEDI